MSDNKDEDKDKGNQKQKEWERLQVMIAEAKRHQEIANAQKMFEPLYRSLKLKHRKNQPEVKRPSVEQVAIARGIITVRSLSQEQK